MENLTNLPEQRRFKLNELKRLGYDPYPRKFDYTHTLGQIRKSLDSVGSAELEEKKEFVRVCGRMLSLRRQGKAGFIDLSDGEKRL
jgi:lysyl-tRNA synthetase, class II